MTKISYAGSNIWNLLEQPAVSKSEDRKQIRDVVPELNGRQIKTDSLELSREGMAALREKVQSMHYASAVFEHQSYAIQIVYELPE